MPDLGFNLLERRVKEPEENVSPPETFLCPRWDLSDGSFVHIPDLVWVKLLAIFPSGSVGVLFKTSVREP